MNKSWKWFLVAILAVYVILMFIGAVLPSSDLQLVQGKDKILHAAEFFVLTLLLIATLYVYKAKRMWLISIISLVIFVFLSEFVQLFTATRSYDYADMMFDALGIIIASVFILITIGIKKAVNK